MTPSTPQATRRLHLGLLVDRPDVDGEAEAVGGLDVARVTSLHAAEPGRDLERGVAPEPLGRAAAGSAPRA